MSNNNTEYEIPVAHIEHNIKFEKVVTNYVCEVGPLLSLISQPNFKTPRFYLNSYVRSCQICMRWEWRKASFRIVCESEDINGPVFKNIKITSNSLSSNFTFTKTALHTENFKWTNCTLTEDNQDTDNFVIYFTIEHNIPIIKRYTMNSYVNITAKKFELFERLTRMYYEKPCTDIKINVGNKEFLAHKSILSRSPVFAAMFSHEMLESKENVVDIKEVDPEIFEIFLKFLYLGEIDEIKITESTNNMIFDIIDLANIYQVEDLKIKLADIVARFTNISNVTDHLILADKYNMTDLRNSCMFFIHQNRTKVKDTESFKNMIQTHPALTAEILVYLLTCT